MTMDGRDTSNEGSSPLGTTLFGEECRSFVAIIYIETTPYRDSAAAVYTIYVDYDYAIRGGGKNSFLAISSAVGVERGRKKRGRDTARK